MAKEINPKLTKRAIAFELWMKVPMPMVTLMKSMDVTNLLKQHRKHKCKFNSMLCWCIGKAASQSEDFYLLPVGDKLMQYDKLAVNIVVTTNDGDINTCDIPFSEDFNQFNQDYLELTKKVHDTCQTHNLGDDYMVIGTSALTKYEIDGAVNIYAGFYNNPFMIWGKYRKGIFKTTLTMSFQFHHTQMDGAPAANFLELLQEEIKHFRV